MPDERTTIPNPTPAPPSRWRRRAAAILVGLCVGLFIDPFVVPPDTAAYFSWGWSAATDADFSFVNEFSTFQFERHFVWVTGVNRTANDWPIGSGLAWLPALAPSAWIERLLGIARPTGVDRLLREWAPGPLSLTVSLAWTTLLALFVFRWSADQAARWFGRPAARAAAWIALLGTPFFFYLLFGPFFSHLMSFAATGLFLLLWLRWRYRWTPARAIALGLVAGWMACVRPQSALFALVVPIEEAFRWFDRRRGSRSGAPPGENSHTEFLALQRRGWPLAALAAAGAVLGFLPQTIAWGRLYGSPFALPKLEEMHWLSPAVWSLLVSDYHGILAYTPAMILVAPGLWFLIRKTRGVGAALAIVLLLQLYVNAANMVWWSSGSFGNRRLLDASAIVLWCLAATWAAWRGWKNTAADGSVGVAAIADMTKGRTGWRRVLRGLVAAAVILACAWTLWLALAERLGLLFLDRYVPFDRPFLDNLLAVWTEPGRLIRWMISNRGLGWASRLAIAGLVAVGWIAMGPLLRRLRESDRSDRSDQSDQSDHTGPPAGGGAVRAFPGIGAAFALAALVFSLRTPPMNPDWLHGQNPPRQNGLLAITYIEYGHYLLLHDRCGEALTWFRKADRMRPGDLISRRWVAIALRGDKQWREAAVLFDDLLRRHRQDVPTRREASILVAAWTANEPDSPGPWEYGAQWLELDGRPEEAREYARQAQLRRDKKQGLSSDEKAPTTGSGLEAEPAPE